MKRLFHFYLLIPVMIGTQASQAMDLSNACFPRELHEKILAFMVTEDDQETRIDALAGLRRVCSVWNTVLTDKFIAEVVGIPMEAEDVQHALFDAIKEGKLKTIELICKVHPHVIRALREIPLFMIPIENIPNGYSYSPHFPRAVEILLLYGLNVTVTVQTINHDGSKEPSYYEGRLLYVIATHYENPASRACIDFLLKHATDAAKADIFHKSLVLPNMYTLHKLVNYCNEQDVENACRMLLTYMGPCCRTHLEPLIEALILRGANPQWRTHLHFLSHTTCANPDKDFLSYHLGVPVPENPRNTALPRRRPVLAGEPQLVHSSASVRSSWTSKIPYLIGGVLVCCLLYNCYWSRDEDADEQEEETSGSNDAAENMVPAEPVEELVA